MFLPQFLLLPMELSMFALNLLLFDFKMENVLQLAPQILYQ